MHARASEYTLQEAEQLYGRRYAVAHMVQDIPEQSVVRVRGHQVWRNGYAVIVDVEYCPDQIGPAARMLTLKEVHENLVEC